MNIQRDHFSTAEYNYKDIHTHPVLIAIFPGEPGLAGCLLILLLRLFLNSILFEQT